MDVEAVTVLGTDERLPTADLQPADLAGATVYRAPDGRWLLPAFRAHVVAVDALPPPDDEDALATLVLDWVETVRAHDWEPLRGARLDSDDDWVDLRTAMVRVGWGPRTAQQAWEEVRARPYSRDLPTAAGWAGAGWVVPAVPGEPDPVFAKPVLEARGLLRWAYILRWADPVGLPDGPPPTDPEPLDPGWADIRSRLRQDHHTEDSSAEAEALAVALLGRVGLGPRTPLEAEDEPLPDRDLVAACEHPSPLVRDAAWFLLRVEADAWLGCSYGECQHHWAVEAEEDAYEMEEVLEFAAHGVPNPVDAAFQRRRLLTLAFGDIKDVPLAGAGDLDAFLEFYREWVARGRPEEDFQDMARELRGE